MTKEIKKEKLYYINDFPDPHDDCTLDRNEFEDQNKNLNFLLFLMKKLFFL